MLLFGGKSNKAKVFKKLITCPWLFITQTVLDLLQRTNWSGNLGNR
jgi:hypothetical protein